MASTGLRAGSAFAAVLAATLAASSASGAPVGAFRSPAAGSRLEAGAIAEISWGALSPAPPDSANEMEIVLSLDGGMTFPIRITRDLDVETRAVAWRVPSLATSRARLAVRRGDSEDPETETILFESDLFAIEADAGARAEPLIQSGGEWRTADALDGAQRTQVRFDLEPAIPENRIGRSARREPAALRRSSQAAELRLPLRLEQVAAQSRTPAEFAVRGSETPPVSPLRL